MSDGVSESARWGGLGHPAVVLLSLMQIPTTRVDKATFKQIFRDCGEAFWQRYGHSFDANVREVVDKMLGCGDLASGYSTYRCEHCHEVKRVAFSCR